MTTFIEILKRLFSQMRITEEQLNNLLDTKKITKEEYEYIIKN